MSSKRKRSELQDSDEDEPTLGKQVLPVANLPADFNGEPEDGLQYLFMVRRDARLLPHTTKVVNPYELNEEPPLEHADLTEPTSDSIPSEEWRELFLYRFKNFRKNCTQPTVHVNPPPRPTYKIMPDRKERDHWWAFLNGRPESEWNPPKKPKKPNTRNDRYGAGPSRIHSNPYEVDVLDYAVSMDPTESLPTPSGTPIPPDRNEGARPVEDVLVHAQESPTVTGHPKPPAAPQPTPVLLRDIDHRYAIHLLMYFAHWINLYLEDNDTPQQMQMQPQPQYVVTETHGQWMFTLLARVDEFTSADETSTLRSLARGCLGLIKLRMLERAAGTPSSASSAGQSGSTRDSEVISEASCWMIVTAIIGLWAQRDLWQDAEQMLAKITSS